MTVGLTFTNHDSSPIHEEAGSSVVLLPSSYGLRTHYSALCIEGSR
jgi:hypothetical protein